MSPKATRSPPIDTPAYRLGLSPLWYDYEIFSDRIEQIPNTQNVTSKYFSTT